MSESTSLIPTAVAASGYGSKPAGALQKKDGRGSSRTRVAAGVASACALLGVGRVRSLEVRTVQLALAAGPDRRLAAGSICDQEDEERSHRLW